MIWQNPWAWLGLGAVVIPILIHLLGRDRAPRYSFPSLRFIDIAELPPTRRTRLHDRLLLATRVAIVGVAAAALTQPLVLLAARRAAIDDRLARAIIVDTSVSMLRPTLAGVRAVDSARTAAKKMASEVRASIIVETTSPTSAIRGAVAWLESERSRRELVVISDFQVGTIDSAAIATIPVAIGFRALQIATPTAGPRLSRISLGHAGPVLARIDLAGNTTDVSWARAGALDSAGAPHPRIEIDAADRAAVDAVSSAANTIGVTAPIDTGTRVTVVFPDAIDRQALARRAQRVASPKLIDLVARIRADSLVASAHGTLPRPAQQVDSSLSRLGPVVTSDPSGTPAAVAAEDTASGAHRLLVFSNDSIASNRSAALIGAVRRSLSVAPAVGELEPSTIPSAVISSWQRAPGEMRTRETVDPMNGPSDARWVWIVVLALIGVEGWLRRERRAAGIRVEEGVHDRAA